MFAPEKARARSLLAHVDTEGEEPQVLLVSRSGNEYKTAMPKGVFEVRLCDPGFSRKGHVLPPSVKVIFVVGPTTGPDRKAVEDCATRSRLPSPIYDPQGEQTAGLLFCLTLSPRERASTRRIGLLNGHGGTSTKKRFRPHTHGPAPAPSSPPPTTNGKPRVSLDDLVSSALDPRVSDADIQVAMVLAKLASRGHKDLPCTQIRVLVARLLPVAIVAAARREQRVVRRSRPEPAPAQKASPGQSRAVNGHAVKKPPSPLSPVPKVAAPARAVSERFDNPLDLLDHLAKSGAFTDKSEDEQLELFRAEATRSGLTQKWIYKPTAVNPIRQALERAGK